jgi:hypothetical protein
MRAGRCLSDSRGTGTIAMVWDPITTAFTDVDGRQHLRAGHAALGDGRILIAGGHAGGHTGLAV